jgi:DNA polymerase-3 subunit epsilon
MKQKNKGSFDLDSAVESIKSLGFKVIRPLTSRICYTNSPPLDKLLKVAILDTETTGLNLEADKIIELGIVIVEYCPETGHMYRVLDTYNELEDPGMLIPSESTKIHGITDDNVREKRMSDVEVETLMADVELVIAHNAAFDRGFVEVRFPFFKEKAWACSLVQIPWKGEGFSASNLEFLAYRFGFHFSAHRAEDDCFALLEVLNSELPVSGVNVLKMLLDAARTSDIKLWALNAPYKAKDKLKKRGYRWDDVRKTWCTMVLQEEVTLETDWLKSEVYENRVFQIEHEKMDAYNRFSTKKGITTIINY